MPLYCAVVFSLIGLVLTAKAAPIMLGLALPQSAAAAPHAFDEYFLWGVYLRGTTIALTFIAVTRSLARWNQDHSNSSRWGFYRAASLLVVAQLSQGFGDAGYSV